MPVLKPDDAVIEDIRVQAEAALMGVCSCPHRRRLDRTQSMFSALIGVLQPFGLERDILKPHLHGTGATLPLNIGTCKGYFPMNKETGKLSAFVRTTEEATAAA